MADPTLLAPEGKSASDGNPPADTKPPAGTKPAEGTPPPADDKAPESKDAKPPEGAPEKYEFKAAEGFELNPEILGEYSEFAKGLKLSQADAQKGVDLATKLVQQVFDEQAKAYGERRAEWVSKSKADKALVGEDGQGLNHSLSLAQRAVKFFGDEEVTSLFEESGLGDHPALLRFLRKIGAAMSDDMTQGDSSKPALGQKSDLERLYPDHFKK